MIKVIENRNIAIKIDKNEESERSSFIIS